MTSRRRSRAEIALLAVIAIVGGGLLGVLAIGVLGGSDEAPPAPAPPTAAPPANVVPRAPVAGPASAERWTGSQVLAVAVEYEFLNNYTYGPNICAVVDGGSLRCFGDPEWPGLRAVPTDAMREVRVSESGACALTVEGGLVCWGDAELRVSPESPYEAIVDASYFDVCLLDASGRVTCHSLSDTDDPARAERRPEHPALARAEGSRHTGVICGVTATGEPSCFGRYSDEIEQPELLPPPGLLLRSVHVGQGVACGIDPDGEIVCWGERHARFRDLPAGPFIDLTINSYRLCGLREDGTVVCVTYGGPDRPVPADLRFQTVALATGIQNLLCGVTVEGDLACWIPGEEGLLASEILGNLRPILSEW